ncbi:MAG: 23S rRNA (guanosine(2251)-2'-O)-methyltransferase RlmB [Pseudomonadota bacterium]|nr:23S rRNA (guanosine(2251)-2'-O)-methyltransferase RlmB [Pseudomonadota bacterium]
MRYKIEHIKRNIKNRKNRIWIFGVHAVTAALLNPNRVKHRLMLTPNASKKFLDIPKTKAIKVEITTAKQFCPPLDNNSAHQGAALEADPLKWGPVQEICKPDTRPKFVVLLDRLTDPNNVGAIIRSAEVFGSSAVIAPLRYSAPETGALAKSASGALERQPYIRVKNLSQEIERLKKLGYWCIGLEGSSETNLEDGLIKRFPEGSFALVLGGEGKGLRELTKRNCDELVRIGENRFFGSLNVSNAAAVAMFCIKKR